MLAKPTILTDKSRLQEIYNLRVKAYEHSEKSIYVNRKTFPNGWFDELDKNEETIHWIIEYDGKIIASARLAILRDINLIKDLDETFEIYSLPTERPFAYWSRLVVHPEFRNTNAMMLLDNVRKGFLINHPEIKFALCWVTQERRNAILRIGFVYLGDITIKWSGEKTMLQQLYIIVV